MIRVLLKPAGTMKSACSRQGSTSFFMDHRPVVTHLRSRRLPLRTKQYSRSKTGFPRGKRAPRIPAVTGESHTGHAFAVLGAGQFSRCFARRDARCPRPLEVVSTEPAGDIDCV